ncbi:hypothetical protein AB1N83_010940 [Pleurotus pulmonarius]
MAVSAMQRGTTLRYACWEYQELGARGQHMVIGGHSSAGVRRHSPLAPHSRLWTVDAEYYFTSRLLPCPPFAHRLCKAPSHVDCAPSYHAGAPSTALYSHRAVALRRTPSFRPLPGHGVGFIIRIPPHLRVVAESAHPTR